MFTSLDESDMRPLKMKSIQGIKNTANEHPVMAHKVPEEKIPQSVRK
jgi:hypothetical protein